MGVGLRELLELPEASQATNSEQVEKLRQLFVERMGELNRSLQTIAGQANAKDFESLDGQRLKLYEAFQKTSTLVDKGDASTGKESVKRMLAALESIQAKAADTASGVCAGHDEWLAREDEFDSLVVRIGELEDAGNSKAATLRKLADSIRARVNECDYGQSLSALDQLQPKFEQIYQQHQQAADAKPGGKADQLGGVFPEIVGEQLQSELMQTDSLIAQLEEAQFPNASKYRHTFIKIRELAQTKAVMKAAASHNRLREFVDADIALLNKSRLGGVKIPEEYAQKTTRYSTGVEIPTSPPQPAYPQPPQPPQQYQEPTKPTQGAYQGQPAKPAAPKGPGHCVLKKGSRGPDVAKLQEQLGLPADGDFGPKTEAAVKALQGSKGLKVDGVVGPQTWAALGSSYAPPTAPPAYPTQPPKQGPYPPQPPKKGTYPPQPPKQGPYPPEPPKKGPYPPKPPKEVPGYPTPPPDQYEGKYPAQPPNKYEPLQREQYGDKPPKDDYAGQPGYTEVETRGSANDPLAADYYPEGLPYTEGGQTYDDATHTPRDDQKYASTSSTGKSAKPGYGEPLAIEETGDKSKGEHIQMEGFAEGESDATSLPFGVEPGAFLNDTKRNPPTPPPPRDDPLVGQNKPIDPDDKFAGVKGTFDEILGVFGLSGLFSDVPGAKGDPAEYNPDKSTKSSTKYGHLRPKDGPLESDPPPPVVPIPPENPSPPTPPPLRTWGAPDPQPGDPNFIGPPAPPVQQMVDAPAEVVEAISDAASRLFGSE
jgi:peptidoglycan hydrolase-like protein with peptidoglycan-binding domain